MYISNRSSFKFQLEILDYFCSFKSVEDYMMWRVSIKSNIWCNSRQRKKKRIFVEHFEDKILLFFFSSDLFCSLVIIPYIWLDPKTKLNKNNLYYFSRVHLNLFSENVKCWFFFLQLKTVGTEKDLENKIKLFCKIKGKKVFFVFGNLTLKTLNLSTFIYILCILSFVLQITPT